MTWYHSCSDLGSVSDWLKQIRSTTQIWVVTRHQYGICPPLMETSFWLCRLAWIKKVDLSLSLSQNFLRSYLRRHFVGKTVWALPSVGCFLRLFCACIFYYGAFYWRHLQIRPFCRGHEYTMFRSCIYC